LFFYPVSCCSEVTNVQHFRTNMSLTTDDTSEYVCMYVCLFACLFACLSISQTSLRPPIAVIHPFARSLFHPSFHLFNASVHMSTQSACLSVWLCAYLSVCFISSVFLSLFPSFHSFIHSFFYSLSKTVKSISQSIGHSVNHTVSQ